MTAVLSYFWLWWSNGNILIVLAGRVQSLGEGVRGESSRVELRDAWRIKSWDWYIPGNQITKGGNIINCKQYGK